MTDPEGTGEDVVALLKGAPAFAHVPVDVLESLARRMERVVVPGRSVLLRQGDEADEVFVVALGRLRAFVTIDGHERAVNDIGPGDLIGELALLTARPRTATVRALRDSVVWRVDGAAFHELVETSPALLRGVAASVTERLLDSQARTPVGTLVGAGTHVATVQARTITLVPAGTGAPVLPAFATQLAVALSKLGTVAHLSHLDGDDPALHRRLHVAESEHRFVLYEADATATAWTTRCLRHADLVLRVADARGPVPHHAIEGLLDRTLVGDELTLPQDLVLVHDAATVLPSGTAGWLRDRPVTRWHHVRRGSPADHDRVARSITGCGVGVVLGGGGPRGFAHLGVLRALEERGFPIDVVGGTSIGAIMAASCAMGWTADERDARLRLAFGRDNVIGWTLPIVSLSSGARVTSRLRAPENFGDQRIEDLWTPFYAISANLSRGRAVLQERGPVWRALRASVSLPGILPPVWSDGDLLVDGGVVDNLPVGEMRRRLPGGTVIAVQVEPDADLHVAASFAEQVSGWRVLADRLNPRSTSPQLPGLLSVLLRSKEIGGRLAQAERIRVADVDLLLQPPTDGTAPLDFRSSQRLIDTGYDYAMQRLQRFSALGPGHRDSTPGPGTRDP